MLDPFDGISPTARARQLGERIRNLRLQRNMTQAALAASIGVSRPTMAALEKNGRGTIETLAATLYALGRESEFDTLLQPDPPSTLMEAARPTVRLRARP
jgi:transcriptional regulator with XRE-family HTH domain